MKPAIVADLAELAACDHIARKTQHRIAALGFDFLAPLLLNF
jgi:hypothetical protein